MSEEDLDMVDLIDEKIIKEALDKLKKGKNDCSYNFV